MLHSKNSLSKMTVEALTEKAKDLKIEAIENIYYISTYFFKADRQTADENRQTDRQKVDRHTIKR